MKINRHYQELKENYLFSEVAKRVAAYTAAHPDALVIRLGIGDVTLPLCRAAVTAMEDAAREMGTPEGFHGYGPEQGYDFLRNAIQGYYADRGVSLEADEIFVSDGAKSDLGNCLDLFDRDNTVLVPDPVYPVYVDTNLMAGRKVVYAQANEENGFLPLPDPTLEADLIYLCSPNNPTGAAYSADQLQQWVDYAREHSAVILYDAAYEAFITDDLPRSIFEIKGAKECAIEFCSFSKTAGFTGTRCGYTVVPHTLVREGMSLNKMWLRRQCTKFNGVPYLVQRGAAAVLTPEGQAEIKQEIAYYQKNAAILSHALDELGIWYTGGKNSPYIWLKCGMPSWDFFDLLLQQGNLVGTPGAGFGENGEGFFRLTAFGNQKNTKEAVSRLKTLLRR